MMNDIQEMRQLLEGDSAARAAVRATEEDTARFTWTVWETPQASCTETGMLPYVPTPGAFFSNSF